MHRKLIILGITLFFIVGIGVSVYLGDPYLHFFDQNCDQYLLNLFSHPEGMREVFSILEEKFEVSRDATEKISYDSRILFPKAKLKYEPHSRVWLGDIPTIKMGFKKFISFTHPKAAILSSRTWEFAKQEKLLSEIGKELTIPR